MLPLAAVQRRASWAYGSAFLATTALLIRSLFAVPYLPTNDGPEHVIAAHIANHFGDPATIYAAVLRPVSEFASRGFSLVYDPLEDLLGWRLGLRVALAIVALTAAYGFVALVRAIDPRRLPLGFLGFPLALTWELYMGFFPFSVGSAIGLFVLALAVRWEAPTRVQRGLLAFLLLLVGVCHVFSAVLVGCVVAILAAFRGWEERKARGLLQGVGLAALVGLPAAMVLLASFVFGGSLLKSPFSQDPLVLPLGVTLGALPRLVTPGPMGRALLVLGAIVGSLAVGAFTWKSRSATDRALLATAALFLLLGVAAPMNIPGWQFFSPRFLPLAAVLSLATLPVERLSLPRAHAVAALLAVGSVASLLVSSGLHRRLADSAADAIEGLDSPVKRRGMWLPFTLKPEGGLPYDPRESEVPFLAPLRHIPMLYAVEEGGLTPYTFANNAATYPFLVRTDGPKAPPIPMAEKYAPLVESDAFFADPRFRSRVVNELATYGMFYEGILVTGASPADIATFLSRGFVPDAQVRSVLVAHFVPCTLDLDVRGGGELPLVDVGVLGQTILRDEHGTQGEQHVVLRNAPCGQVWVRPHRGAPASFCQGATPTGELAVTLGPGAPPVVCEMR